MRTMLAVATIAAMTAGAHAAPWEYQTHYAEEIDTSFFYATQWTDTAEPFGLGYECDNFSFEDALYVQTPEKFDPSTSYAPDVPTTFAIDGQTIDVSGKFQNSEGDLYVYFYGAEIENFQTLFDALVGAQSDIRVKYFDKDLSFSPEGAQDAVTRVFQECRG